MSAEGLGAKPGGSLGLSHWGCKDADEASVVEHSESAPVPIARHATGDGAFIPFRPSFSGATLDRCARRRIAFGHGRLSRNLHGPPLVILPAAMVARTDLRTLGMKLGVLVEWDELARMRSAKNEATMSAVMTALEPGE